MGLQNMGPFSGFSGKVGNLIGASWRDKDVLKGRPRIKRNRKLSAAQEEQSARFSMASQLTRHLSNLIKISYGKAGSKTAHNTAYQEILNKAIGGVYPDLVVNYSKLPIAKGRINEALNAVAVSTDPGKVKFTWTDNTLMQFADGNDTAILVVYCEEMDQLMYIVNGAIRSAEEDEINVPFFAGKQVHTWISFLTADKKEAANSVYTGMVTLL